MNKKGKSITLINYLLVVFIIVCSIFSHKTIYIDLNNTLQVSLSSLLYPFTFLFIVLIYKKQNFKEAHNTILKTSAIFLIFMLLITILNSIPSNNLSNEIDFALKQVLTPNTFIIKNIIIYYPNIINTLSFILLFYLSHTLILILYEAMEPYIYKFVTFSLAMFIPFAIEITCLVIINNMILNSDFAKIILDLTSNFIIVTLSTLLNSIIYYFVSKKGKN